MTWHPDQAFRSRNPREWDKITVVIYGVPLRRRRKWIRTAIRLGHRDVAGSHLRWMREGRLVAARDYTPLAAVSAP